MHLSLSPELIGAIRSRIQDPRQRAAVPRGEPAGIAKGPDELEEMLGQAGAGISEFWRNASRQMQELGASSPFPMQVTRHADGSLSASSRDFAGERLAPPATEASINLLEEMVGRSIPRDLRQLYAIADGGFGPGLGPGLYSLERVRLNYDDLRRRGPDYTCSAEWPRQLLPLTDNFGPVSYDMDRGAIVAFNEYWRDHSLTLQEGFTDLHPTLEAWLRDWLETAP